MGLADIEGSCFDLDKVFDALGYAEMDQDPAKMRRLLPKAKRLLAKKPGCNGIVQHGADAFDLIRHFDGELRSMTTLRVVR